MDKRGSCGVHIIFILMYSTNGQTKDSFVDISGQDIEGIEKLTILYASRQH